MRWMLAGAVLLAVCTAVSVVEAKDDALAVLYGEAADDSVRLLWRVNEWPRGVVGFQIRRRLIGEDGTAATDWNALHIGPISLSLDRQGKFPGVSDADENARLSGVAKAMRAGPFARFASRGLRDVIAEDPKWLTRFWSAAARNFDVARVLGLGFVDYEVQPAQHRCEYGLFAVYKAGDQTSEPVDTWISTGPVGQLAAPELTYLRLDSDGDTLVWTVEKVVADQLGVMMYTVQRKTPTGMTPVTRSPIHWAFERDGGYQWRLRLKEENPPLDSFVLTPVNAFGTELAIRE